MCQTQDMVDEKESGRHFLPVLATGFALLVVILLASRWIAIDSMRFVESDTSRFVNEQQERGTITLRRKDGSTFPYRYAAGRTNISALTYYVSFGLPDDPA